MDRIYRLIRLNRLITNHRVKYAAVLAADILGLRHLFVRLDPVFACNLRCSMCLFSDESYRRENTGAFTPEELERLARLFFPRTLQLVIGCGAEPTLYKDFPDLVHTAKSYRVPFVGLVSNGQLLGNEHLEKLVSCGLDELSLSLHGVERETYEKLMEGASYARLHEVLTSLDRIKARSGSSRPGLRINYTVSPDNLEELRFFFDRFGNYRIAALQIRPVMDLGRTASGKKDLAPHLARYDRIIQALAGECRTRGIIFMANRADPTYKTVNPHSLALEAVIRHVSPRTVWRTDFNWRAESCRDYCKRTGWRRHLLRCILTGKDQLESSKTSLSYEIDL